MLQLHGDEGPAFCRRPPGAAAQGDQGVSGPHPADVTAAEAIRPTSTSSTPPPGKPGGTGESFDWELLAGRGSECPLLLAGGLDPDNVADAIAVAQPYAVDVASGVESEPGVKDHELIAAFIEKARSPDGRRDRGRDHMSAPGPPGQAAASVAGGRGALRPLRRPLRARGADRGARRADRRLGARRAPTPPSATSSSALLRDFVGRPTPLYLAERLSERAGRRVYLKREDLAHTGAHKINNAVGQALLAAADGQERGSSPRPAPASTASPPPPPARCSGWTASSTWAPRTCAARRPNVERMELIGATVEPVEAGARTLKEAVSAAIRDWVTNVERHALHHRFRGRARPRTRRSSATSSA